MADIPESLLRRSAEAKAKALGVPVEQVLAEMKGEAPPSPPPAPEPEPARPGVEETAPTTVPEPTPGDQQPPGPAAPEPAATEAAAAVPEPAPAAPAAAADTSELLAKAAAAAGAPESIVKRSAEAKAKALGVPVEQVLAEMAGEEAPAPTAPAAPPEPAPAPEPPPAPEPEPAAAEAPEAPAAAIAVEEKPPPAPPDGNGHGNGKVAATVVPRPAVPPENAPEGVRTQRLLTVVKARAIQQVKAEPSDKVNTWPHLMIAEFTALLAVTALLVIMSVVLQAPLLEPANFNATPNPSKAPWYFLGLQELLSYFDPQIAGVTVPTIIGLIGFMMIPYIDRNPSTKPSDRKFAIMLYSFFLAGSAVLTIFGVLFRGRGFNWAYPWRDGIFFDDLKDWISFE